MAHQAQPDDDKVAAIRTEDLPIEEDEFTEEQRDAQAQRCLRIFNTLLMLLGGALCGLALWASTFAIGGLGTTLAYAVAGIGGGIFFVTLLGLIGTFRRAAPILMAYYTFIIFAAFGMMLMGGVCFILNDTAVEYVRKTWDLLVAVLPADKRMAMDKDKFLSNLKISLFAIGGGAFLLCFLLVLAMSNVIRLVTPAKAYTLFLQATSVTMLPVGVALVGASAFVAETAVGTEAPLTAFAVFVLGVFVISLVMVGCCGTSLRSRGIIRLFMVVTGLLGAIFIAFGVTSLVIQSKVQSYVASQWSTIRKVLPPNFDGKYDKEQFERFLTANLTVLGFLALCTGILLVTQVWASFRLRAEIRMESEFEQEALDLVDAGILTEEEAKAFIKRNSAGALQRAWKRWWTKGTCRTRCCVRCACFSLCGLLVIIIGVAAAALYYSTSCRQLSTYSKSETYGGNDLGPLLYIHNNFTRGNSRVAVNTASNAQNKYTLQFTQGALREKFGSSVFPPVTPLSLGYSADGSLTGQGVTAVQLSSEGRILGFDVTCQTADITLTLPRAGVLGGNTRADGDASPIVLELTTGSDYAAIDIDWAGVQAADRPRVRRTDLYTTMGPIDVNGMYVGSKGLSATTSFGEVLIQKIDAQCDPDDIATGAGGVRLVTDKGGITLSEAKILDCDVYMKGGSSLTRLVGSTVRNTLGGGTVSMVGAAGVMEIVGSTLEIVEMKGEDGSVRITNSTIYEAVKASSASGSVVLSRMRMALRSSIQAETDTGNIEVWATQFAGIVSVVTGGTVTCIGTGFDDAQACSRRTTETSLDGTTLTVLEQVDVNCRARADCAYLGGITITSSHGNVVLRMDKWQR